MPPAAAVPVVVASSPAKVARLACAQRCGAAGAVRPGSLLRVRGRTLSRADEVVFMGGQGVDDDVVASTSVRRKTSVDVRVPLGAVPGPVAVVDRNGAVSAPSAGPVALEPAAPTAAPSVEVAVRAPHAYYDAAQPAAATYVVHASAPVTVGIDVVRASDGAVVAHWDVPAVAPETAQRVLWDGTAGGVVQPDGRYLFRVSVAGLAPAGAAFEFSRERFPILGPVALRHRRGGLRRRARAPGRGRLRRVRDAAGGRPRRRRASTPGTTRGPATTS